MGDLDMVLRDGRPHAVAPRCPVGMLGLWPGADPPENWLVCDGSAILVASYPALSAAIYCGDGNNAAAAWGYRCTASNGTGRSTSGAYIVLPDARDRYVRGWTDGGSYGLWSYYADVLASHTHPVTAGQISNTTAGGSSSRLTQLNGAHSGTSGAAGSGSETRPRTIMALPIIHAGP